MRTRDDKKKIPFMHSCVLSSRNQMYEKGVGSMRHSIQREDLTPQVFH